jgi:hypothetical protein
MNKCDWVTINWGSFAEVVTAIATLFAVVIAGLAIWAKRRDDRRADRLSRINRQLSELYGKLESLNAAGQRNWYSFVSQHSNDLKTLGREFMRFFPYEVKEVEPITRFNPAPPDAGQLKAYRKWLKTLFMETNEEMLKAIIANADLVVGKEMPQVLIDFAEHVATLRLLLLKLDEEERLEEKSSTKSSLLANWEEHVTVAPHPAGLGNYISAAYEVLKEEQERLLSTHGQPFTEKEIADKIKARQWEKEDSWCKKEHEARKKAGQLYEYKPVLKP